MNSQKLNLKNRRGQNIVGILTKPENKIIGTAVLQHGYGGSVNEKHILVMQKAFLINGFQVFNFDSPNSFGESDGEYKNARLGLHANDFDDVTNWVLEQEWFTGKLLVSGHSMGGFASARYALRNSNVVDFAIPFAPVVSGKYWFDSNMKYKNDEMKEWKEKGVLIKESYSTPGRLKESPYDIIIESLNHNLLKENLVFENNILLIACEKDTSCSLESVEYLFNKINSKNKIFKIISGSNHVPRNEDELNELKNIVEVWLSELVKNSE